MCCGTILEDCLLSCWLMVVGAVWVYFGRLWPFVYDVGRWRGGCLGVLMDDGGAV